MPHIKTIGPDEATGQLKEIYDQLLQSRGKLAGVHQIQSLNPPSLLHHMELYMSLMFAQSPLQRYQREMMAVVVSATNRCAYCAAHHGAALQHYWKDERKIAQLQRDYTQLDLGDTDLLLCQLAEALTLAPESITPDEHLQPLRETGLDDRALLDATLVISYFNFVNRLVLGLGVALEEDKGEGYLY
ncbi:peroxidase-related enzyme [Cesiribacter andamanensis]|uniref:Carboxymuconolactone decarboxylase-like domain-containing protein n=1 Tax=Cesiribacter andamanensis AMV16 TaxID=1279009 RepID=M7N334_9BACT|nr:peroxidase-related enzyme [Cesiribacter andamanensis]EMR01636.1 hypothetical protein ADICEAN_03232 [Cesiribacter andamanensis AMV16]